MVEKLEKLEKLEEIVPKEKEREEIELDFYEMIDEHLVFGWTQIKISKGSGHHICSLCHDRVQKRKMKILGKEDGNLKHYILCFPCWGGYKTWEKIHGGAKPGANPQGRFTRWKIPINR